jgi:hypothetical protein
VPPKTETALHVKAAHEPPLLMASPEHMHSAGVFGIWSLPDRSTAAKKAIEDQLDAAFEFYHKEVEQRHWYGFWNYGDVMHQHDGARHEWRYDIGGIPAACTGHRRQPASENPGWFGRAARWSPRTVEYRRRNSVLRPSGRWP